MCAETGCRIRADVPERAFRHFRRKFRMLAEKGADGAVVFLPEHRTGGEDERSARLTYLAQASRMARCTLHSEGMSSSFRNRRMSGFSPPRRSRNRARRKAPRRTCQHTRRQKRRNRGRRPRRPHVHARAVAADKFRPVRVQLEGGHAVKFARKKHAFSAGSGAGVEELPARRHTAADRDRTHRLKGVFPPHRSPHPS